MTKRILYIVIFLASVQLFSQRKYVANEYFKRYNYTKAVELYKKLYDGGDNSKLVLERLGDCYYNNSDTKNAVLWYEELMKNYKKEVSPIYLFKYAQSLKGNGNYELANTYMEEFKKLNPELNIVTNEENTSNYLSSYLDDKEKNIHIHNLSINTKYSDFGGFVKDNKLYYASSFPIAGKKNKLYKWNNQPFLELYKTNITQTLHKETLKKVVEVESTELLSTKINTKFHEASMVITKDGKTMYFTRDNYDGKKVRRDKKDRKINLKIYKAELENDQWTNITELPFNNDNYSVGHPTLSVDEKTLYFVSNMPGGIGGTDLYKVSINNDNSFGIPQNLGKPINTEEKEMFPFIGEDGTLYFSSNGHLGLGLLDVFEVIGFEKGGKEVKNIKAPFNSKKDDFAFTINKDNNKGFFSSNREGGNGDDDIYSFQIEECKQQIKGTVTDSKTLKPIELAIVKLINSQGEVLKETQTNRGGNYSFELIDCAKKYVIIAEKQDYRITDHKEIITSNINEKINKVDLMLTPLIIDNEIVINPIFFDFDKSNIRDEASYELEKVVSVMKNNPDMIIKIESHTDCRGTKRYNRNLSDRRAKSTRDYIISRGIATNRIASAIGYGEDQLLFDCNNHCDNCTEEQHQRNRRSKFIIVSGGKNVDVNNPIEAPLNKIDPKPRR